MAISNPFGAERQLRNRTSILECPTADFSRLTESFKAILRKEAMEQKINAQKQMAERKKAAVRHDVYEASDEKQLWKAKLQGTGTCILSTIYEYTLTCDFFFLHHRRC